MMKVKVDTTTLGSLSFHFFQFVLALATIAPDKGGGGGGGGTWYSLEAPQQGASNEYPQHMFSWINKKKNQYILYFLDEKKKKNKRTMMVLYRSPEQTALQTYC